MVAADGQHGGGSYCRHQPIPYMKYCHEIRKCPLSLQLKAASGRPRLILGADERQNESGPHLANPTLGSGRHQTVADVASETSSVSALACSSYGRQRMPSQTRKVRRCALFSSTFRHMPHTVWHTSSLPLAFFLSSFTTSLLPEERHQLSGQWQDTRFPKRYSVDPDDILLSDEFALHFAHALVLVGGSLLQYLALCTKVSKKITHSVHSLLYFLHLFSEVSKVTFQNTRSSPVTYGQTWQCSKDTSNTPTICLCSKV